MPLRSPGLWTYPLFDISRHLIQPDPILLHGIAVPNGDRTGRQRVAVNGDAERRARFVHSTVPPANGSAVVVEAGELAPQLMVKRRS